MKENSEKRNDFNFCDADCESLEDFVVTKSKVSDKLACNQSKRLSTHQRPLPKQAEYPVYTVSKLPKYAELRDFIGDVDVDRVATECIDRSQIVNDAVSGIALVN